MIIGLDLTYTRDYKNVEMEIICEDDTLTIAKAFVNDKNVFYAELGNDEYPNGLPNTKRYIDSVWDYIKEELNNKQIVTTNAN